MMRWRLSHRADPLGVRLADRHYSRVKRGTPQFVTPGRCVVLITEAADALWVSTWSPPEHDTHAWPGAWVCSLFRNESPHLSSELIIEAIAATRWRWGDAPSLGMITFINVRKVRHKRDPGRCFRKVGFRPVGYTGSGLLTLQLLPDAMPHPAMPLRAQFALGDEFP